MDVLGPILMIAGLLYLFDMAKWLFTPSCRVCGQKKQNGKCPRGCRIIDYHSGQPLE